METSPQIRKERQVLKQSLQSGPKEIMSHDRSPTEEVKLAAIAISLNARLRSSDMPLHMQEHALRCARSFVDSAPKRRPNPTHLARVLKKSLRIREAFTMNLEIGKQQNRDFDSVYGPAWHCVVGKSFGSFVTHSPGGFMYFSVDSLFILLFKTEVLL